MTISAYLEQEQDPEIAKIAELTPEAYKGLTTALAIDKAEQSILDEITGVDDADENNDDEELREEREMKSLFESLYEIDPETKEPFVKGSAYDLKKWDEDMVCFAFGQPDQVIALEDFRCPGERYLQKMFDLVETKETSLNNFMRRHRSNLDIGLINKDFAKGYAVVMGHPLQTVRMESFTNDLTGTNYSIAMEEMTQQQMALAAGGAILGIGLVYKMIQWFAKALNKNSLATGSISQNFGAYFQRKELLKNGKYELAIAKDTINDTVKKLVDDYNSNIKNVGESPALLKQAFAQSDAEGVFNALTSMEVKKSLKGKMTPFIKMLIEGKVNAEWWSNLNKITKECIDAQTKVGSAIEFMMDNRRISDDKPQTVQFDFLATLPKLLQPLGITVGGNGFIPYDKGSNNFEESINSFNTIADQQLFILVEGDPDIEQSQLNGNNSLKDIDVETFNNFSDSYINSLVDNAKDIEELAKKFHGDGEIKDNTDKIEIANKRERIKVLVKEFKLISSILRFVIRVRNQLGVLSMALAKASETTLDKVKTFFTGIGGGTE